MPDKPTILFIAIVPPFYAPAGVKNYGLERTYELIPHKHSILALVAWLRENGCDGHYVFVYPGDNSAPLKIGKAIKAVNPDAVGFSLVTEEMVGHYPVIGAIKKKYPSLPVILGGPHATAAPVETLRTFPLIDYVAIGEGERTLTEWLTLIHAGKGIGDMSEVAGLGFRDENGEIVITRPRETFSDINILPDPAFDVIVNPDSPAAKRSAFPIVGSYGCKFFCTFCAADHGNYRYMKPERIVNQLQHAQEKYGVEYFAIRDSLWPPSSEGLDDFCDLVESRDLKIHFHFETRAGLLSEEQWARLKKIGAQAVAVGVESGDQDMLKRIKKGITLDMVRETFKHLHKVGIFAAAFFMLGNQGETRESIRKSVRFATEINPALVSLATFRPLPGTEAYEYVKKEDRDWWMRGQYPSICELTIEELNRLREGMHICYPLRWRYLMQNVFGGNLPPEFRSVCLRSYKVHLRKYLVGIAERSTIFRPLIHNLKKATGKGE
ncbi:MAG: radical SAM protein [bacterium]|nr:radical SAM protein [bacterium]